MKDGALRGDVKGHRAEVFDYNALDSVEECRGHILNFDEQCPVFRCLNDRSNGSIPAKRRQKGYFGGSPLCFPQ
jgi:hypothetical protein